MAQHSETALWAWLLFESGLKTLQAKQLLARLKPLGVALLDLVEMPASQLASLGLETFQTVLAQVPPTLKTYTALRWDALTYPKGLHGLSLSQQPALLFTRGAQELLHRPLCYFPPAETSPDIDELLPGIIELCFDSQLLPAVFAGSPQEKILLDVLTYGEGEGLVFLDRGVDRWAPGEAASRLLDNGRYLALSPMATEAPSNPGVLAILLRIACAAAERWVLAGAETDMVLPEDMTRPALWLAASLPSSAILRNRDIQLGADIADAIQWFQTDSTRVAAPLQPGVPLVQDNILPPLPPEQALRILEMGGNVPEVLRRKLAGQKAAPDEQPD